MSLPGVGGGEFERGYEEKRDDKVERRVVYVRFLCAFFVLFDHFFVYFLRLLVYL